MKHCSLVDNGAGEHDVGEHGIGKDRGTDGRRDWGGGVGDSDDVYMHPENADIEVVVREATDRFGFDASMVSSDEKVENTFRTDGVNCGGDCGDKTETDDIVGKYIGDDKSPNVSSVSLTESSVSEIHPFAGPLRASTRAVASGKNKREPALRDLTTATIGEVRSDAAIR